VHRRSLTAVVGLTTLSLALAACTGGATVPAAVEAAPVVEATSAAPVVPSPETEESAQPSLSPSPEQSPSGKPSPAVPTFDVASVQKSLADLGYYLGAADGRRGPALRSAVIAFQKVQGLGADGTVGPATLKALAAPKTPLLKGAGPSNRVEVDLTRQVLYVVKGGAVKRILPISSGNGATYEQKDGSSARALTPTGYYKIQRRIVGVREADLGTLYDPQYFYRGWAIHGSNSVPAVPASHGCIRVTRADAKWLLGELTIGMTVHIYGGRHVFTAGSSAPGTDTPTGDTGSAPSSPAPSPKSSPQTAATRQPSPAPSSAAPSPAASPSRPASASPSPSGSATPPAR
jgi:peptidoglycan hydrolase-like protein with peptidoglycan-binding domain